VGWRRARAAREPSALRTLTLALALLLAGCTRASASLLPAQFTKLRAGPHGGSVWRGVIPGALRKSAVYLPPHFRRTHRYPVVYLLHGMPGSPWGYLNSLRLAALGDTLITRHEARPFIAVVPVAGPTAYYDGEWAGQWEDYLVRKVVPWVDSHLPTRATIHGRTLAGLSAGGYGAVDIALRHPRLFGRLESWGGYFTPFGDDPLDDVGHEVLAAHDPTMLVRARTPILRRLGVRFFLSTGPGHGKVQRADTVSFAHELRALGIRHRLELFRAGRGVWERQLAAGLRWALAPSNRTRR
jgi:enterochelin esterase-like enzyme